MVLIRYCVGVAHTLLYACTDVSCDQGALEILVVSRLFEKAGRTKPHNNDDKYHRTIHKKDKNIEDPIPYNITCTNEKWSSRGNLPREIYSRILGPGNPIDMKYAWGCGDGKEWSCDFKFEKALCDIGFIGLSSGFHMPLSSFSQGCANDYFPEFHITFETAQRPRLHVGHCSNLDEIQGAYMIFDGPLGGGNDYVRLNAINGWLINHKADINFYEAYRDEKACRRVNDFVPQCDKSIVDHMIKRKKMKVGLYPCIHGLF